MAVIKSEYLLPNYDPEEVGMKGEKGDDGKTSYVHIAYSNSSDGGVDFSTTDPTNRAYTGYYTDFEMIDSTDHSKYEWQRTKGDSGKDGVAGKDGVGLQSTSITYASHTNASTPPSTGWQTQVPTVPAGQYLWTKTVWTYTDSSSETGYSVARMGQDGDKGNDGIAGKDGVGIKTTVIEYAVNTSGTVRPTSGWSTTIPNTPQGQYLWTRTTWTYTDNTTEQGYSVARQGSNGQNGTNGSNGVGISTTIIEYNKSTNSTTPPSTGWTSTIPSINGGQYLWTRVTLNYTNGQKAESYTVARQGEDGADGQLFTGETEPTDFNEGDIWYKVVSGKVTGVYEAKGGAWVEIPFESSVIAETIIGKTITGGKINGTTITGSTINAGEFINNFDTPDGDLFQRKGDMRLREGSFTQSTQLTRRQENNTLAMLNNFKLQGAQLSSESTTYLSDGETVERNTLAQLQGGSLNLRMTDSTGNYYGTLDAKLLQSMSEIKHRIVRPPDNANFRSARLEYRRFGQIVTVAMKFDRITAAGWNHFSQIPLGYRPASYIDASAFLASTGVRGSFATVYCDTSFNFLYIPSVPGGSTTQETYQGSVMYFTNDAWSLA